MPRRESYRTDDEDDDLRRARASGGGVPAWVWVAGGGVFTVLLVAGAGFALFRQEARRNVARAEVARMEAHQHAADRALPVLSMERITRAYRNDPATADAKYTGQWVRVRFDATAAGDGWVGTTADLHPDHPPGDVPNVICRVRGASFAPGDRVEVEGTCTGLAPDPQTGVKLVFTDCRPVDE